MDARLLEFDIPRDRIATRPAEPRESARLMVVDRRDPGRAPAHLRVADLPGLLCPGDLVVCNRTRVLPARFEGTMTQTGGRVEGLWLEDQHPPHPGGPMLWRVMLRARRLRPGRVVDLGLGVSLELLRRCDQPRPGAIEPNDPSESDTTDPDPADSSPAHPDPILPDPVHPDPAWFVAVHGASGRGTAELLDAVGLTPLPPYIRHARRDRGERVPDAADRANYQTAFAAEPGSVAAPTAGLHLTPAILNALSARGVGRAEVTLHVGSGTFRAIEAQRVEDHRMHAERCAIDAHALADIFGHPRRRVVAVGSTSTRTIEAYAEAMAGGAPPPPWLHTDLMIMPGYAWKRVDAILTNFHLPRSTLLAFVAGAVVGGIERVRSLYDEALRLDYRFFSYGDAMLLI